VDELCNKVIEDFDKTVASFYSQEDNKNGYIVAKNRKGELCKIPILSVSIGVVTSETRDFTHVAEITQIATELKQYAKTLGGSVCVKDRRQPSLPA
jgi:hypothetical protein